MDSGHHFAKIGVFYEKLRGDLEKTMGFLRLTEDRIWALPYLR